VKLLLKNKADPNIPSYDGQAPLHIATQRGNLPLVAELLKDPRIVVDCKTNDDQTPLHIAAELGALEIFQLLIAKNASIHSLIKSTQVCIISEYLFLLLLYKRLRSGYYDETSLFFFFSSRHPF
jgi:ankyrin repeat protein